MSTNEPKNTPSKPSPIKNNKKNNDVNPPKKEDKDAGYDNKIRPNNPFF